MPTREELNEHRKKNPWASLVNQTIKKYLKDREEEIIDRRKTWAMLEYQKELESQGVKYPESFQQACVKFNLKFPR